MSKKKAKADLKNKKVHKVERPKKVSNSLKKRLKKKMNRLQKKVNDQEAIIKGLQGYNKRDSSRFKKTLVSKSGNAGVDWFWSNYSQSLDYCRQNKSYFDHLYSQVSSSFEQEVESEQDDDDDSQDGDDFLVSHELKKFLETTMRHKLERDRIKVERGSGEEVQHLTGLTHKMNIRSERDMIEDCFIPNINKEEKERTEDIKKLYGKHFAKIHGMETALQLTYVKNCTKNGSTPYWPNVPLTVNYK